MSIKTTHIVTREFALQVIKLKLDSISDTQLSNVLEEVIHNGYYNIQIVSEVAFAENEQEDYPIPILQDINDLPEYNDAR